MATNPPKLDKTSTVSNSNTLDRGKYNIGSLQYPIDLGNQPDLQHSIGFFVNVRGKSKFKYDTIGAPPTRTTSSVRDVNNSVLGLAPAAQAIGIATAAGTAAAFVSSGAQAAGRVAATGAAATALIGGGLKLSDNLKPDNKSRLRDVITLHIEERPSVKYGVNYQDHDLGILGGLLQGGSSISKSAMGAVSEAILAGAASIPSTLPGMGTVGIGALAQFGGKVKTNPFREVFFEGVDYRRFNFRHRFLPKSPEESKAVFEIIKKFKEHMHPELSKGGFFYIYPSEFEIVYYHKNKENDYFNKLAPCALTDMTVEYGGDQFSTFADGSPTEINMTLSFRELELLTKESIRYQGY